MEPTWYFLYGSPDEPWDPQEKLRDGVLLLTMQLARCSPCSLPLRALWCSVPGVASRCYQIARRALQITPGWLVRQCSSLSLSYEEEEKEFEPLIALRIASLFFLHLEEDGSPLTRFKLLLLLVGQRERTRVRTPPPPPHRREC